MYDYEHPWHGPAPHPWDDPLGPWEPLDPRPDAELAMLGGSGPRPEDFPFNWQGKRDYYAAVRAESQRRQQLHLQRVREAEEAEEAVRRNASLLLLS